MAWNDYFVAFACGEVLCATFAAQTTTMVLLTLTPNLISAINLFNNLDSTLPEDHIAIDDLPSVEHRAVHRVSRALLASVAQTNDEERKKFRLSSLLKGCDVYIPPKPLKPEPVYSRSCPSLRPRVLTSLQTPEYKALMTRLRAEAEEREYSALTNKPHLSSGEEDEDEYTYNDLKSHLSIIANVLLSVLATSAAVWKVASGWDVPERLALAFTSSLVVCVAEVVVFGGYLRRIDESRQAEKKRDQNEEKVVVNVWEFGPTEEIQKEGDVLRKRRN